MNKKVILIILSFVNVILLADQFHRPYLSFPKNNAIRKASFPYISGDTFRSIADHIFDETDVAFVPEKINFADIIFINGDMISQFFQYAFPLIQHPVILVTHNTDHKIPGVYASYLDHPQILSWHSQNIDRDHPKLFPLPIGLANYHWPHGKIEVVNDVIKNAKNWDERIGFKAYVNFLSRTNPQERVNTWNFFQNKSFAVVKQKRPYREYLKDMQECKFVISPPGNGLDCHRHWEALLMGAIPVMKHTSLDKMFDDLPVIFVNDWQEVTEQFLKDSYTKLAQHTFLYEKLYVDYWIKNIKQTQAAFRLINQTN